MAISFELTGEGLQSQRPFKLGKQMLEQGLVQVYTGKTGQMNLAHIGLSLRAAGQNLRTFVMDFIPHPFMETEDRALSFLKPNVVVERLPLKYIPSDEDLHERDRDTISESFEHIQEIVYGGAFDIIILEEINQVVDMGIIPVSNIIDLIKKKPANVELVLTGRNARGEIIEQADLVTEMIEHKREEGSWKIDGSNQEGCVSVLQFIKSPRAYGEIIAIERFPNLEIKSMGEGFILGSSKPSKKHREAARGAWEACLREIFSLNYGLIVLDEINVATQLDLVHPDRVREMMFLKPRGLHIILSGRNAHPEMKEHASAVFEMKEIKHPFHKGIQARKGIEY